MRYPGIALFIVLAVTGCKPPASKNPAFGQWEVQKCELIVAPGKEYEEMARSREGKILAPYMQLRYVFREDSTFERTMKNGADSLSLKGHILLDTAQHIRMLVIGGDGDRRSDSLYVLHMTDKLYRISEMTEMGFVDQYIFKVK